MGETDPARTAGGSQPGRLLDAVGLALAVLVAVWTLVSAADRDGARPGPVIALTLAAVVAFTAARLLSGVDPILVPGVIAVAVGGAVVLGLPDITRPGGAPTGYANSNATLLALGSVAAAGAGALSATSRWRRAWFAVALALAGTIAVTGCVAAGVSLGVAALLATGSTLVRAPSIAIAAGLVAVSLTLGVTSAVAVGGDLFGLGERSGVRAELWSSALHLLREDVVRGIGPGVYAELGAITLDGDLRWAHHGYLQQAAEQGVPGLLLLVGLIVWGYLHLATGRHHRPSAVAGASALTVVGLHASVDYVLHSASVTLTLAALMGWATQPASSGPAGRAGWLGAARGAGRPRAARA